MKQRTLKTQWLMIGLGTLLFWGYQAGNSVASSFPKDTHYDACFSPSGRCEQQLLILINRASSDISLQAYSFTSRPIAIALAKAQKRGVHVQAIVDRDLFNPNNRHSVIGILLKAGIPVWIDNQVNIQHNKTLIVDGHIVETGSYNYTYSANHFNAENMLIIDSSSLAKQYLQNWATEQKHCVTSVNYIYHKPSFRSIKRRFKRQKHHDH